ncbi:unnamed protein product [Mytilus edulis]|uniref:VWFA domain-containing protein n=1 Tax=Mytilus edulis TaxID=6550 RepID=A0A8S3RVA1_MYTED|nr:unnamed protein product [Mytilus edulis]
MVWESGIKQVKIATSLEDNIGLAVFGRKSGLIVESTSNYDLVLEQICKLRPGGEAPLFGGFLMGLSGVLGIGATSQIFDNEVQGYMIVFTDGIAGNTHTDKENKFEIDPSYLIGNVHKQDDLGSVISMIASHSIKIFYVPIGDNIQNEILAAQVASDFRRTNPNPTADDVRSSILQRTSNPDDAHEDCVDLVLEFVNPLSSEKAEVYILN